MYTRNYFWDSIRMKQTSRQEMKYSTLSNTPNNFRNVTLLGMLLLWNVQSFPYASVSRLSTATSTQRNAAFGCHKIHQQRQHQRQPHNDMIQRFASTTDEQDSSNDNDNETIKLVLNENEIQQQMRQIKTKYPTSESDYLAASKKRAAMKVDSVINTASDDDWKRISNEKKQYSANPDDDWESSLKDSNNSDNQILLFTENKDDDDDGDTDSSSEPKLLLF